MMLEGSFRPLRGAFTVGVWLMAGACGGEAADADTTRIVRAAQVAGQSAPPSTGEPIPAAGTAWVVFGTEEDADTVFAEVARTDDQRSQGLMNRESLAENAGMLFVFQDLEERAFWMRDTYIALDIAFLDPAFRITGIEPMEPESEELVESTGPAQYALEVNRGWFEEHGVSVGDVPRIFFGM